MSSDTRDPNSTRPDQPPDTSHDRSDEVALGAAAHGGTLAQHGPPSWVQKGADAPGSVTASSSAVSRSGKEVHELDREIERHQSGGGELADGYSLLRKLGTGSFGAVWEAADLLTGERVAIKFFTAGDADWEKLLSEVGLIQAVEGCRSIVMVKQVRPGVNGRRPLYVMQLANDGSLGDWIKAAKSLPPRERVRLAVGFFARSARAMAAVHRRGIHHCDLKPQNILLHRPEPGAPPEPLVADFGQGHLATDDTPALGTFFYMPPDQIDAAQTGTPPDTRWDVYALGAVAYEMLTGEPPRRTPELVERIKKAPKNLVAKMTIYRDGVQAAPRPDAHRTIADPMLAKIIDRCLSLDPNARPRDAGALVALLDARRRWRRTRPVLALAAAATLLLIGLVAGTGSLAARQVTRQSEENVKAELAGSLARTAGYSAPAVERRLQEQVSEIEAEAATAPPKAAAALADIGRTKYGPRFDPAVISEDTRTAFAAWMRAIIHRRHDRAGKHGAVNSLALMVVTEADAGGGARGFFVSRGNPDDTTEDYYHTKTPDVYRDDYSFRDYFHGRGNLQDEKGRPHPPIRATHISDPYQSTAQFRTDAGDIVTQQWKVNIATPLWDRPGGRIVGVLTSSMDLEDDIVKVLEPAKLGAKGEKESGIAGRVKVVLIDHRNRWVWHPDCRGWLAEARADLRLPHDYDALARARGREPAEALPWLAPPPREPDRDYDYAESFDYIDLVENERDAADRNADPEIACFTRFYPFATSKYAEARGRPWVFVAQVDRRAALRPLDDLRAKIVAVGVVAGAVLALIAAGLWAGLFVVLRRLEFASHG